MVIQLQKKAITPSMALWMGLICMLSCGILIGILNLLVFSSSKNCRLDPETAEQFCVTARSTKKTLIYLGFMTFAMVRLIFVVKSKKKFFQK
jgi:hypothetical protein